MSDKLSASEIKAILDKSFEEPSTSVDSFVTQGRDWAGSSDEIVIDFINGLDADGVFHEEFGKFSRRSPMMKTKI